MQSSVGSSGKTPLLEIAPKVGLSPTRPQNDEGMRTEPPVSEPIAAGAKPAATATPEPEEEPPGKRGTPASHGFHGVP